MAVAEYAKSRGKSSSGAVSSSSSVSAAISSGARLLRFSSLTVALAATGLILSTQSFAATGFNGGTGSGTAISVCTGAVGTGFNSQASAQNPSAIAIGCGAVADDLETIAIGRDATASGGGSIAIGDGTATNNIDSVALGNDSEALGASTIAIGNGAAASANDAIAIGTGASASTEDAVAIGTGAIAKGGKSVSVGTGNTADGDGAVAIGDPNVATGAGAIAVGKDNIATGSGAVAAGNTNIAIGIGSVALGANSKANENGGVNNGSSIAIGGAAIASGRTSISLGDASNASGNNSNAIGLNANATGGNSNAIGNGATADGDRSNAIGLNANAVGGNSNAIGNGATADGNRSNAIGLNANAVGDNSNAIGTAATANGTRSSALGFNAAADAQDSIALGANSSATVNGGVALGQNSVASIAGGATGFVPTASSTIDQAAITATNSTNLGAVSVGTGAAGGNRQIVNVAAGTSDSDAVNVSQLKSVANVANQGFNISADNGTDENIKLGETVDFTNTDGNLVATVSDNVINYDLADNITVDRLTAGDGAGNRTTLTTAGIRVTDDEGNTGNYRADRTVLRDDNGNINASGAMGNIIFNGESANISGAAGNVILNSEGANISGAAGNIILDSDGNISTTSATGLTATNLDGGNSTVVNQAGVSFTNNEGVPIGPSITAAGITGVAAGTVDLDAVNVSQLRGIESRLTNNMNDLGYKINEVEDGANAGISAAMAMSSLPQAYIPGKSMIGGGIATYNGESAVAIGLSKVSDNGRWVMKINGTADSEGNAGGAIGAGFHF
jgi:autotransporter adhesin